MGRKRSDLVRRGEAPSRPLELPEGIVTFLLTDIEGSTPLWETHTAAMSTALARHEALIAEAVASRGGQLIKSRGEGDSTLSVFVRATDAVTAALALQQALATETWPDDITLPTRVALHSGEAEVRDGDYYGQALNRAARLRALAHGGHVLLSQGTAEIVMDQLPPGTSLADVGKRHLKGLSRPEHVFALVHPDLGPPPQLRTVPSGPSAAAVSARQAAVGLREAADDQEKVGEGLPWLSRVSWWAGRREEAEAAAARAIAVLETVEPGHQLAMAYSNQAQLDMLASRTEAALAWASRAIELARRLGDQETLTHALTNVGTARLDSSDLGGRADLEQAFEVAVAAGLEDHAARALGNLAGSTVEMRDYRHARGDLDRALTFVAEHDLAGYAHYLTGVRACVRLDLGDWAGAEQDARSALAEWEHRRQGGIGAVYALVALGRLQARRGDPDAAATLQEASERAFATDELQWIGPVAAARAEHAWLHGETDRVAEEAASAFGLAVQARHPWLAGELACWLWRAGALPEVPAVAAEPYRLLLAGDWQAAADAWQALGCPYDRAQALAHGDAEAGQEALRLLDDLGASQAAQRLRHQLGAGGAVRVPRGPSPTTAANSAGLTRRQLEVLRLLAGGQSNAEIAARLSLSVKTVDHHVSALLAKLAAGSRREAAAAARRLGVAPANDGGRAPQGL
jgi:class 3 adenylate cyclase/DNA-binding CsgD family transcriptional regulator